MILQRLKGRGIFNEVLHHGKRFSSGPLMVFYTATEANSCSSELYTAYVVGKKNVPLAVRRNRIKRVMRAAMQEAVRTDQGLELSGFCILLWRSKSVSDFEITLQGVLPYLEKILQRIRS